MNIKHFHQLLYIPLHFYSIYELMQKYADFLNEFEYIKFWREHTNDCVQLSIL